MTISQALRKYHKIEIELLLMHVLRRPKEFLFMCPAHELTQKQEHELTRMVEGRLKGEPMAYILGYKDFYGLRFKVNKNVLIPRPETEELVQKVLSAKCLVKNKKIRILDVGTGSGCIAIALAKKLQAKSYKLEITATDISKKALAVAKENAKIHKVKIKFIHSNILENVRMSFDIIIANLPYGWSEWKNNTSTETAGLKCEPKNSLFTKEKGLFLIKRLLSQIAKQERKPKCIFLEFDPRQKYHLSKIINKYLPKAGAKYFRDLNNLWRVAEIIPQLIV
jgi:release factor glutamine methyltransferase